MLLFGIVVLPGRSFHRPEKTIPTVAVKHSGVFFFGEPDKRGFADQMVLRNESEQARISQVNGVVGSHPIIIFGEITVLCWLAVHIKSVVLDFRLFTFMHHEGVSQ